MFRVRDVKDLYVVKRLVTSGDITNKGDLKICDDVSGEKIYLQIYGGGGKLRSDVINPKHINYANAKSYNDLSQHLKQVVIELDSTINSGNPVSGEIYEIMGYFPNWGLNSEENIATKIANVYAVANMTAGIFYVNMARELFINLNSRSAKFFKVYVTKETTNKGSVSTTWIEVNGDNVISPSDVADVTGIIISEQSQKDEYKRGVFTVSPVMFTLTAGTIHYNASDVIPFVIGTNNEFEKVNKVAFNNNDDTVLPNGYDLADLEYFAFGERGDVYHRGSSSTAPFIKWMIDEEKQYDVINISHYHQGWGTDVQKLDKEITLAIYNESGHTVTNSIITALNGKLGTNMDTIS